jgi:hypothetical protein
LATNKNQHFVPKSYLRAFSERGEGKSVHLFNIDRRRLIYGAPTKHQCSGDYFYGKDPAIDRPIQEMEGLYAAMIRKLSVPGYVLSSDNSRALLRFALLQYLRTEAASKRTLELWDETTSMMRVDGARYRAEVKEAVQHSMGMFLECISMWDDLAVALIRNRTGVGLVTSDDPCALANRWFDKDKRTKGQSYGLGSAGAVVILPLSREILMFGYDRDTYQVQRKKGWVDVTDSNDIRRLNEFQFMRCRANIYFADRLDSQAVPEAFEECVDRRPPFWHKIEQLVLCGRNGGHSRFRPLREGEILDEDEEVLVHMQSIHPSPSTWPSFIGNRPDGVVYSNGSAVGFVRKSEATRVFGGEVRSIKHSCNG